MRPAILLPPRNSRKFKGIAQMAAATDKGVQRLTFYEDLYLKPHKKSASMPSRCTTQTSTEARRNTQRQSSLTETQRKSSSTSPINNPLLDSPPSARPLTLPTGTKPPTTNQPPADDTNNNKDYLVLSERMTYGKPTKRIDNAYENPRYIRPTKAHRSANQPMSDHVYEVIPAQLPGFFYKTLYLADESNYLVPSQISANEVVKMRKKPQRISESPTTNLKSMRRIGRSVDSIKTMQDSRLRSQSTILAPQLWVKTPSTIPLANSASCDNLLSSRALSRLSDQTSSEKENSHPYTCVTKSPPTTSVTKKENIATRNMGTDVTSPQHRRPTENDNGNRRGTNSIYGTSTKGAHNNQQPKHCHRHSASYAGSTSAYENMNQVLKGLNNGRSEYVNIEDYINDTSDLNYADLDLTLPKPSQKPNNSNKACRSATVSPTKSTNTINQDADDSVEYTFINIAATQAARLACAEHQQDRQRRPNSRTS